MSLERDHSHDSSSTSQRDNDHDDQAPGRASRSALLRKPDHAVASGLLSRKARDANGVAEGADAAVASASSSSGSPLPDTLMRKFESSLGANLSGVRVHTGSESAAANDAVGARAYTMGNDIHFGAGQYDPSSSSGQHLLAHEVAHTVQQSGGAQRRQFKLEVSSPDDALEHEADRAADAMVAGQPASVGAAGAGVSRMIFRDVDPGAGALAVAGDTAANAAMGKQHSVDSISVSADIKDVNKFVADIKKSSAVLEAARETDIPRKQEFVAVNTEAATKLSIFKDKLNVSSVDTSAFALQYRIAYADFQRLNGAAHELMLHVKAQSNDEIGAVTDGIGKVSGMKLDASAELTGFEAARQNLNSAAKNMNLKIKAARDAANALQSGVYKTQAAAAKATAANASSDLTALKAEIAATAAGVGKVVKLVTAVAGFAGSGGATGAAAGALNEPGSVTIQGPANVGELHGTALGDILEQDQTVVTDPEKRSKLSILKGMYSDAGKLNASDNAIAGGILSGDPAKMAETLVTAIGEHANRKKIERLETMMTVATTQASVLTAASEKLDLVSKQGALETAAASLEVQVNAFAMAKKKVVEKRDALMEKLSKGGGKKGSDQAKIVVFLTDADRFLAQVDNAIGVGKNQQANMAQAADDRKSLRGTHAGLEGDGDLNTQRYYQCTKLGKKPWNVSGDYWYSTPPVYVEFNKTGFVDANAVTQGGAGTVEGVGGAGDSVAGKIKVLETWKAKIKQLQTACQDALFGKGKGEAGLNG